MAALLVIGTGLAVAAYGLRAGDRESVLAIGRTVAKGEQVHRSDLVSVSVAGVPGAIAVGEVDAVVGKVAVSDLVVDQVLTHGLLTSALVPGPGSSTVGLALDPGRVPGSGLVPGDSVDIVAVPPADSPAQDAALQAPIVLAPAAQVVGLDPTVTAGGQQTLTVVVDGSVAARVAAYAAQGLVAVVEVGVQTESTGSVAGDR